MNGEGRGRGALAGAAELVRGQQRVHRSGAEAFQIEGDELEAECFEDRRELRRDCGIQSAIELLAGDLNADDVAVMADAKLAEAEGANGVLAALYYVECFARYRAAVFDARREASGSGLVPDAEAGLARKFADFLLGEARFQQRCGNVVLRGGLLAGTKVALVILIHTVGDCIETARGADLLHDCEEFVLAVEAALAVVAGIFWAVEFGSRDDFEGDSVFIGEGDGVGEMGAGQARRIRNYSQHVFAEFAVRDPGEIGGVNAAGVGHKHAAQLAQGGAELSFLERGL
jgi:hypothetical protein